MSSQIQKDDETDLKINPNDVNDNPNNNDNTQQEVGEYAIPLDILEKKRNNEIQPSLNLMANQKVIVQLKPTLLLVTDPYIAYQNKLNELDLKVEENKNQLPYYTQNLEDLSKPFKPHNPKRKRI